MIRTGEQTVAGYDPHGVAWLGGLLASVLGSLAMVRFSVFVGRLQTRGVRLIPIPSRNGYRYDVGVRLA
jgi:hypothetical protein